MKSTKKMGDAFFIILTMLLGACSGAGPKNHNANVGTSVGNGMQKTVAYVMDVKSDLSGAKALTFSIPNGADQPEPKLLKVDANGQTELVIKGPGSFFHWKETPTHIIAQVYIKDSQGICRLIAIPKVEGVSKVLCLSPHSLTPYSHWAKTVKPRFDVQGSKVFFPTHQNLENSSNRITELQYWDGKSESTHTLYSGDYETSRLPPIAGVYASDSNDNICFSFSETDGINDRTKARRGRLLCRQSLHEPDGWVIKGQEVDDNALKFKNSILLANRRFNLATLDFEHRQGPRPLAREFELKNGGFIGRGFDSYHEEANGKVVCVDKNGDGSEIASMEAETSLVKIGDWVWFYGVQSLRRVWLDNCTLDTTDYYAQTQLVQIAQLSWARGDFLRLDGTNRAGRPAVTFLTGDGKMHFMQSEPVKLEHPIELKWDRLKIE